MVSNDIILNLTDEVTFIFSSNNPNIDELIRLIIKNRDKINYENIDIKIRENNDFDYDGFIKVVKEMVKNFLESIELQNKLYGECLAKIEITEERNDI